MIPLCVSVRSKEEIARAQEAGAEAAVLSGGVELRGACEKAALPVIAVRLDFVPPEACPRDFLPTGQPPTLVLLPPPAPRPEDLRSVERVKSFLLRVASWFEEVAAWAEESDHTVAVTSRCDSFFETSLEITELLRAAGSERLMYSLNTFDAELAGEEFSGATDVAADILAHVVAEDRDAKDQRAAPGKGTLAFDRVFEQLTLLGYSGAVEVTGAPEEWSAAIEALRLAREP